MSAKVPRIERKCEHCGKVMLLRQRRIDAGRGRYCSAQCRGAAMVDHMNAVRKPANDNPGWFKSEDVRGKLNPQWKPPVELTCKNCGKTFYRPQWILNQRGSRGYFCSILCRGEYRAKYEAGKYSLFWLGGPQFYRGVSWRRARATIVEKQKGICADCGKYVGNSLPVHHIKPFREFHTQAEANAIENLVGLCQSCHMKREHPKTLQA